MHIASETGLAGAPDRIVVADAYGTFVAAEPRNVTAEGEWIEPGEILGQIETSRGVQQVTAPCRGWVVSYLAENGDRVQPGKPLVHLESV